VRASISSSLRSIAYKSEVICMILSTSLEISSSEQIINKKWLTYSHLLYLIFQKDQLNYQELVCWLIQIFFLSHSHTNWFDRYWHVSDCHFVVFPKKDNKKFPSLKETNLIKKYDQPVFIKIYSLEVAIFWFTWLIILIIFIPHFSDKISCKILNLSRLTRNWIIPISYLLLSIIIILTQLNQIHFSRILKNISIIFSLNS